MPVLISGVLKDAAERRYRTTPFNERPADDTTKVVVNTVASEKSDDAGRYSMDGAGAVHSHHGGRVSPVTCRSYYGLRDDSKPGT